ncbi:hypothetical protein ACFRR6_24540 [Streptomyces sp. NPDC056891]|uniref:hypothetical protein n=1 Tax=Streptomyces sp. NPDC056891 TaxID=3345961 RepID=UPI0036A08404
MTIDHRATRVAYRDRQIHRARRDAGYRLPPLDAPPADQDVALTVEIALCRAKLALKAGSRQGAC